MWKDMGLEVKRFGFKDRLYPNQLTVLGPGLLIGKRQATPLRAVMKTQLRHRGSTRFVRCSIPSNISLTEPKAKKPMARVSETRQSLRQDLLSFSYPEPSTLPRERELGN